MAETETYEFTSDTPPQEIHDKLASADKITALNVTLDTKKMREDGALLDGDDYTLERFHAFFENSCQDSNADDMKFRAKVIMPDGRETWGYCGVKIKRCVSGNRDKYRYSYIGFWRYAWNLMYECGLDKLKNPSKWRRRWCAVAMAAKTTWYMRWGKFRDHIRDLLQRWIWRQQPAFILNKPEGRPNGDAEDMDVS